MQSDLDLQFPPVQSITSEEFSDKDPNHPKSILFDRDFHYSPADSTTTEGSLDEEKNPDQLGDSADEEQRS